MFWNVCNSINGVLWVYVITFRCGMDHVLGVDGLSLASMSSNANAPSREIAGGVVDSGCRDVDG